MDQWTLMDIHENHVMQQTGSGRGKRLDNEEMEDRLFEK
jgi:hypothetical protein